MTDPLKEAMRLQREAAALGFDWRELGELWDKLAEEVGELQQAVPEGPERVRDELGDLLFMAVNLARHLGADPGVALAQANEKFTRRFGFILSHVEQLPPIGHPQRLVAMEALWQQAKKRERSQDPT